MTVKEFADSRGVSKQLVYQMVKSSGKQISDLAVKGQITESGLEFLESIIPDKSVRKEQDGSEKKPVSESDPNSNESLLDHLRRENDELWETVRSLRETLNLEKRHHIETTQKLNELKLRLEAGSPDKAIPINAEGEINPSEADSLPGQDEKPDPEGESQEEKDPETDQPEDTEKKTDQEPDKKDSDPEKPEGESSSPVTDQEQSKQEPKTEPQQTETKTKPSLRKRLHYLFHGE